VLVLDGTVCRPRFRRINWSHVGLLAAVLGLALLCRGVGADEAGASSSLPDGRAWEMVSPLDKNGGGIAGIGGIRSGLPGIAGHVFGGGVAQISADGQQATYVAITSFADPHGSPSAGQYLAQRGGTAGWSVRNLSTATSNEAYVLTGEGTPFRGFSSDLSSGLIWGGDTRRAGVGIASPPLAPGAPPGYENYYLDALPGRALQPLLTHAPSQDPGEFAFEFLGSTPSLDHVVLSASAPPNEGEEVEGTAPQLYEWNGVGGKLQPVSVLPNGAAPTEVGSVLGGSNNENTEHAISEDGSRVIWTQEGEKALYVREGLGTGHARTVRADAPDVAHIGSALYLGASSDASKVFFADTFRLTGDSTAEEFGLGDLYLFEPAVGEAGRLADLTVDHGDPGGAEVQGVLGASADGSYLYFVANGVLAPGAAPGNCNAYGESPPSATCNLYLWHGGEIKFIAALSADDEDHGSERSWLGVGHDWSTALGLRTTRVSRDGSRLVFMSQARLRSTNFPEGYDSTVSGGVSCGLDALGAPLPAQCEEVFVYEAATGALTCVSCNPSGVRPTGPSSIPGATEFKNNKAQYESRVLSEGEGAGRVFFNSADGIAPTDSNGVEDVYEYEAGHPYLLSDGKNSQGASFVDASTNGDDVLFVTRAQLVPQDIDQLVDLYDARSPHAPGEAVGFPVPVPPAPCEGEDCFPAAAAAPAFAAPSSSVFVGPKNAVAKPKPAVKKKPKPKKKPKRRRGKRAKARARHARARHARAAGLAGAVSRKGAGS
jgi:hypothetical protein